MDKKGIVFSQAMTNMKEILDHLLRSQKQRENATYFTKTKKKEEGNNITKTIEEPVHSTLKHIEDLNH